MPAPRKLTNKRRLELEGALADHCEQDLYQAERFTLEAVISLMTSLGLRSYGGYSLTELKRLQVYTVRVFFHRSLAVSLYGHGSSFPIGRSGVGLGHLATHVTSPRFTFTLTSEDYRRQLVARLACWPDRTAPNYVTPDAIHASMGRRIWDSDVTLHFRTGKEQARSRCWHCNRFDCTRWGLPAVEAKLETAFDGGIVEVWHLLDRAWADMLATRPMPRPLTFQTLRMRCRVHAGQTVKVFTTEGPVLGTLDFEDGRTPALLVESGGITRRTLLEGAVLEIVPYRL